MLEKFLTQVEFNSMEDFRHNFKLNVPDNFNFAYDVVDKWAEEQPNKLALLWTNDKGEEKKFTFKQLKEESDKVAGYLYSIGIGKGDMVMLILKRRYQFWTIMLGLHKIGAVAIPATFLLTTTDIIYRCKSAEIKAIICCGDNSLLEKVEKAEPKCPYLDHLISIGPVVPNGWEDFNKGVENATPWCRNGFINNNEDPFLMYFTSGTSDDPKMVLHSFTYPLGHIITSAYWHNSTENDLHLTYSDTGWGKAVWGKLYGEWIVGATIFVYDHEKFIPKDLLEIMSKYKVTSFCAPPTIYRFLIREDFSKVDLSNLTHCYTAGEALNPSVFDKFHKLTGVWIKEAFGQTESTLILGTFPWIEAKPGSMGVPSPMYDVDIVLEDGSSAKVGEKGVIVIKTSKGVPPGMFTGYYRNPKLTKKAWNNGIYSTGDMAYKDENGYFWFEGRNDDLIKTSGYRVSPFEVESEVMKHPSVLECAVTGAQDPEGIRGIVVKATIVLTNEYKHNIETLQGKEELSNQIKEFVKQHTAPYKYPRIIDFVDALPKTISGKIRHVEIRSKDAENKK